MNFAVCEMNHFLCDVLNSHKAADLDRLFSLSRDKAL